jgi:hypothetical protein
VANSFLRTTRGVPRSIETNDLNMEKYDNSHENQEISILRNYMNKEIHCAQGCEKRKTQ